uniref:Uncharacterized protein n=1 Tax=viral metagenome TaxID=1070528 RepID=A0A6C0CYN9_9ZZZZ
MQEMSQEQIDFANMLARDIQQQPRSWVDVVRFGTWSRPQQNHPIDPSWDWWYEEDNYQHYESETDEDRPTEPWEEPPDEDW